MCKKPPQVYYFVVHWQRAGSLLMWPVLHEATDAVEMKYSQVTETVE